MSSSLRQERKLRTKQAIAAAALHLFALRGYANITVPEIAAAAKVGERTLYRYYADKEELLFAEDEDLHAALRAGIERQPVRDAPFTVLRAASLAVARTLQDRREDVRRRAEVIADSPALAARQQSKHAAWAVVLADGLAGRGVGTGEATLLGRVAVACFDEAMTRWLAQKGAGSTFVAELDATFNQLGILVLAEGSMARGASTAPSSSQPT